MNIRILKYGFTIVLTLFLGGTAAAADFTPPEGKVLFILGQDRDSIREYVRETKEVPGGLMLYTSLQRAEGLTEESASGAGTQYGDYYLVRYPESVIQLALYMVGVLEDVPTGRFDKQLTEIGAWIKKADRPVYVRIGYEFDLPANHYEPAPYQAAYGYIVDFWRTMGVRNAAYVWHSYAGDPSAEKLLHWYPGDTYVDWFAISYFGNEQRRYGKFMAEEARARGKPFMIAESTPAGNHSLYAKEEWLRGLMKFVEAHNVRVLCYIHTNWEQWPMFRGQGWGDSRFTTDQQLWKIWSKVVYSDAFLHAHPNLFKQLSFEKPL